MEREAKGIRDLWFECINQMDKEFISLHERINALESDLAASNHRIMELISELESAYEEEEKSDEDE